MEAGRPKYWIGKLKEDAIDVILIRIENGESVRTILNDNRDNKKLPSRRIFNKWLIDDDGLSTQYAHACEVRAENIFEDILSIADESENDVKRDKDGKEIINGEVIQRSRLRVDARKWYLSKLSPKKYGDKIDVNSNNVNHNINQDLTAEDIKKISDNLEDNY
jgi:hypothetical protein